MATTSRGTAVPTELWRAGAAQLAELIRSREVSSREVVIAHLHRIAQVNGKVNAIRVVLDEEALATAGDADRRLAAGEDVGPLHGVPITVKENIDVADGATTSGVAAFAENIVPVDSPQVAHLRAAGAIPLGRTNMPDFGLRWHTDNELCGATRNPWDPSRTPGGSSGGEAVALATGMTPLGCGNDLGGSLRWPSQCNGTSALMPTFGRVPRGTVTEPRDQPISFQLMWVEGPMARSVADLRLALEVMCLPTSRDPWWVPAPLGGPALPQRVAVVAEPPGGSVEPAIADGVRRAAEALVAAGYEVHELEPPELEAAYGVWRDLVLNDVHLLWPLLEPLTSAGGREFGGLMLGATPELDTAQLSAAFMSRQRIARAWMEFQETYPLVLGPVATAQPFRIGADLDDATVHDVADALRFVVAVNALGLPSAAVPVGAADGLPLAVQVIGPRFREDACLDAAAELEQALGTLTPIDPRDE